MHNNTDDTLHMNKKDQHGRQPCRTSASVSANLSEANELTSLESNDLF